MAFAAEFTNFLEPVVQCGFAGFSLLLLWALGWMYRENRKERREANEDRKQSLEKLIEVLIETNRTIAGNTEVIGKVCIQVSELHKMLQTLNDRMLARPCIAKQHFEENI